MTQREQHPVIGCLLLVFLVLLGVFIGKVLCQN